MSVAELVDRERARVGRALGIGGAAAAAAGAACVLCAGIGALGQGRWMRVPAVLPIAVWVAAGIVAVAGAVYVVRRVRRSTSRDGIARTIETERGLRRGSVRGAIEVATAGALGRYGARALADRLGTAERLVPALYRSARRRAVAGVAIALAAAATLGATASVAPDGWAAVRHPLLAERGLLLPGLRIIAPRDVPRGQSARVRVAAAGRATITVAQRVTGAPWSTASLAVVRDTATVATGPIDADLALVATDGRVASDTVVVRASDRPFVGGVVLRAVYPTYLHRAPEALAATDVLRLPRGTAVEIEGRASTALSAVSLAHGPSGAGTVSLRPSGHDFAGRLIADLSAQGRWSWSAAGPSGPIADVPLPLDIDVIADSAPTVAIVEPARDTVAGPTDRVALSLVASDDHGLSDVAIRSWRVRPGGTTPTSELLQHVLGAPAPRWTGDALLDLSIRGLAPGDALHVIAEVTDDSPWQQHASSRELVLRIPSLGEQREIAREAADSTVALAAATAAAERQLAQRTEEAARSRGARGSASGSDARATAPPASATGALPYDAAERAKALGSDQHELGARVDSLRHQAERLEQQLRQAGTLDSALASRLAEAQQLLRDALTPELQQQLDRLNRAATALNAGETRQSLSDLSRQQQRLRAQLDRTVDLLKRAALEGAMQAAHDDARDLASAERSESGRTSTPATSQQLAERARALSRQVQQLSSRLAAEQAEAGAKGVEAARSPLDSSAQALAQRNAGAAAGATERAAKQLADARRAQVDEWKSALTDDLDRSVQETMELANQEQSLATAAQRGTTDRGDLAAQQSAVEQGVQRTAERLQRAARQSALVSQSSQQAVGQAGARVQEATTAARASQPGGAGPEETAAAMHDAAQALTSAAGALARDRARAAGAASASGLAEMLQQMQQLAQQQGQLNSQADGLSMLPGGSHGSAAQGAARSLADGERRLAQSLDRMGQGGGEGGESGAAGGGSNADALAREARQIADALEHSGLDRATIVRQERLYHRLLDAGHTLEKDEQDSSGKRVAQAATGREPFIPPTTVARGASAERFAEPTWAELRPLAADERQIVLDYFKRINAAPDAVGGAHGP
jgi:hypothetical protein